MKQPISAKRYSRVTEAKLTLKRAEDHRRKHPYLTEDRKIIRDLQLVVKDLLEEVAPS